MAVVHATAKRPSRPPRRRRPHRWAAFAAGWVATQALAAGPLVVYYNERPPYLLASGPAGEVTGLTGDPARRAFRQADIPVHWVRLPSTRQLATLREAGQPACAVGWFKNPEREAVFRFTDPIYQDRPTVAVVRAGFTPASTRLGELMHQPGLRILVKDRYSYGGWIDGLLARERPRTVVTSEENVQMVRMIAAGRADLMFAAQEEAQYLVTQAAVAPSSVRIVKFDDVPPGEKRYVMCSRAVPEALIERLNQAIRTR